MSTTTNALNNSSDVFDVDNLRLDGNTLSSTDTDGNVILAPDGSGAVSVTTAPIVPSGDRADSLGSATNSWDNVYCDGLTFDDGSNILARYEVDSWTPALEFGGGSTGIVYSIQTGNFVRIGPLAFVKVHILISNKGSSNGNASISGLPFGAGSTSRWAIVMTNTTIGGLGPVAQSTAGGFLLYQQPSTSGGGLNALTDADFSNNSQISMDITMRTS